MVVVGADVHKRSHTFVAVDEVGRRLGEKTVAATSDGHRAAVMWAHERFGEELRWGIEDCRNMSARLERDLLDADQAVVRVPTKLMAATRKWTKADLLAACEDHGIPAGPINDMEEVFADPQVRARGLRIEPQGIPGVRAPIRFSDADLALDRPSPRLGEDNG